MKRVYLDHAATSPVLPLAADAVTDALVRYPGNPSSSHKEGRAAREFLEAKRKEVTLALGAKTGTLIFSGGATESNQIVFGSFLRSGFSGSAVVSAIEHPSVREAAAALDRAGINVRYAAPGPDGIVRPGTVAALVDDSTAFVSVMAVNNETGAVQPVGEIAAMCADKGTGRRVHFHCDAVQAFGKIPFSPDTKGLSSCSGSAHKTGGPKGSGILWTRNTFEPLLKGGGQENGMRPGTESVSLASGSACAFANAVMTLDGSLMRAKEIERQLLLGIRRMRGVIPVPENREPLDPAYSPWIISLSAPGLPGETIVRVLDDSGFAVSTGSACSRTRGERRVLQAMGVDKATAFGAIRVSTGPGTTAGEMDLFLEALESALGTLRG